MRVGIDATCWQNRRGYGRHARALLGALLEMDQDNHYTFFVDQTDATISLPGRVELKHVHCHRPAAEAAAASGRRSLVDMWKMGRAMSDRDIDLLLFPTVYSFVPVFSRSRKLIMIHDVIAERYPELTLPRRLSRQFWKAKVSLGRWQSAAVVTVSEHSRACIAEYFRLDPARIFVVGEAADAVFQPLKQPRPTERLEELGIDASLRLVTYVGGFNPHKNLETLLASFARLARRPEFDDVQLVLVGDHERDVFHSYYGTLKRQVESLGLAKHVCFSGYLPDNDLVALLNLSAVLVLPSLLEGFGLPAVEAAACGVPVIATTESPLPQLLREGGLFVKPLDELGWSSALAQILSSEELRKRLGEAGREAAQRLSWQRSAREMLEVFNFVMSA
jgi:glycosyltransferase involved in cell wall biosynthesis